MEKIFLFPSKNRMGSTSVLASPGAAITSPCFSCILLLNLTCWVFAPKRSLGKREVGAQRGLSAWVGGSELSQI